jgi:hypothetical protein
MQGLGNGILQVTSVVLGCIAIDADIHITAFTMFSLMFTQLS